MPGAGRFAALLRFGGAKLASSRELWVKNAEGALSRFGTHVVFAKRKADCESERESIERKSP